MSTPKGRFDTLQGFMKILDLYTRLKNGAISHNSEPDGSYAPFRADPELRFLEGLAKSWELDLGSIRQWFASSEAAAQEKHARLYLERARDVVGRVEEVLGGGELPGVLVLMPSFGEFDGFARYDSGSHTVLFGIDFPGSDLEYLTALTAHELSHVYRDHSPRVWEHLGKPLSEITRKEYLDASSAEEHLASEGLATLFSQLLFHEIEARHHHYYEPGEWQWCLDNDALIDRAFQECLKGDRDVWSFYSPSRITPGSPSRTQYYWAAKQISKRIESHPEPIKEIIRLHGLPAHEFQEFMNVR